MSNLYKKCFHSIQYLTGLRDEITLRDPVPTSKARFMMRIIYALKAVILERLFPMSEDQKAGIRKLCHFFLTLYAVPWFTADDAAEAAVQDWKLFQRLHRYKRYAFR